MAAAAGVFNHAMTAAQALTGKTATPMDSSTTGTSGTGSSNDDSGNSATISANDFLTLLVTEMQNQDPTADTDPNEYINQLVQVNSLEQLIDINQTLSGALDSTATGTADSSSEPMKGTAAGASSASPMSVNAAAHSLTHAAGAAQESGQGNAAGEAGAAQSLTARHLPGNLSVPATSPAGQRVAHALDGRMHGIVGGGNGIALQ